MKVCPSEKGRGTTDQGRTSDPERMESLEQCSVLNSSLPTAKCISLPAVLIRSRTHHPAGGRIFSGAVAVTAAGADDRVVLEVRE
jgi:hypothetical protein